MASLGLCLFPPLLTQGRGAKQVSGVLHLPFYGWGDLLPALPQQLRQEEKNPRMDPGPPLKYLGSFLTSQWHKPLSWKWTLGEEHKTDFADPINLLLWKPCGTPVPVVPASWSIWCEAKTLLKSLHPLCLVISLDTVVRLSQTVSGWRRARPAQAFSLTCRAVLIFQGVNICRLIEFPCLTIFPWM